VPSEWLQPQWGKVQNCPHDALLLRWTSAIKEKAEKLLGNATTGVKGYLAKGVVVATDAYVIAVNARLLRGSQFPSITGISQYPYAVEAAFAVGPLTVMVDRTTLKAVDSRHEHRPLIRKPNGANVPAYTFLDPAFAPVSAIWAADVDDTSAIGNRKLLAAIHNPNASNPVSTRFLPAYEEFVATQLNADEYELAISAGVLAKTST
jgi:type I restriction enzyme S subunit